MILSDREIRFLLERNRVTIEPRPAADGWSSTAVDLQLDPRIRTWNQIKPNPALGHDKPRFRPGSENYSINQMIADHTTEVVMSLAKPFIIERGDFVLGWTFERVALPHDSRIAARVEGKSSLARIGLGIHVTAPTIHAGFGASKDGKGLPIQLEIWNVGPLPIELIPGIKVCQLIFEEVHGTPEKGYAGQFAFQGPADRK